ncbi:PilW family protein [Trinickia dinghuensis]|uniref:Type IV pillus assembly protein n=1 Tax=Trinickia dinghuensis TaxID=2291023 RepID=A0A3D8JSW4_9BURK|nr:PilW family protein [Trinickia dinghuensis]RDU95960.1 type IV pillus assembly protein [Trinickia dinghuensis]
MIGRRATGGRNTTRQAGHMLLEWLVASALGLVVLAGTLTLYRVQRESFAGAAERARMLEAGAAALMLVGQQIQMAGYAPLDQPALRARVTPGIFGCQSGRPKATETGGDLACTARSSDRLNSDGLIVRYADDAVATWHGASGEPTDCLGQGVARHGEHAVIVNRFYVAQPERRDEPELYCDGSGNAGHPQPVVEGIDRIELSYWLRGAEQPIRARALAPMQWADVVAVDLCVVVLGRGASGARGFVDCGGNRVSSLDGRRRLSLSRHLVLRNRQEPPP